jgi:hypothetical protein
MQQKKTISVFSYSQRIYKYTLNIIVWQLIFYVKIN